MVKRLNLPLIFVACIFMIMLNNTGVKAVDGAVKSSVTFNGLSNIIENQRQSLRSDMVSNGLITSAISTTASEVANSSGKVIKNPDVDFNYIINIQDLASMAVRYNIKNSDSTFNSKFDLNNDGVIDIYDLTMLSKHLGGSIKSPSLNMETYIGDTFNMPGSIETQISDGYLTNIRCNWTSSSINTSSETTIGLAGQLADYKKSVTAQVKVTRRTQNFNSINYGLTAVYNNKVYYSNPANNFSLSRCNLDGSSVVKICNDSAFYINVVSDWIYYVNESDNNSIYKIKTDGTGRTKISDDKAEFMNIADGWIYYSNGSDYYTLYKIKLDGTKHTKLNDLTSLYVYLYGEQIYFCDYSTYENGTVYGNLCSINKDGTGYQDVTYTSMKQNVRIGNTIYYLNENGYLLYTTLDNKSSSNNISGGWGIYDSITSDGKYLYASKDANMYKYDPSTDSFAQLQRDIAGYMMSITGGNLYVCGKYYGGYLMRSPLETMDLKVFGIDDIIKNASAGTDKVYQYDKYIYPNYINAERLDGSLFPVAFTWDSKNVDTGTVGSCKLSGRVQGYNSKAVVTVNVMERGNINQNLGETKHFAQKGDYTYITSPFDHKLYKVKNDGSERIKLSDNSATFINVFEDYVYYINPNDSYIHKVKTDGTSPVTIYFYVNSSDSMVTDGNKIYVSKSDGIYSLDMDGSNPKKIVESNYGTSLGKGIALVGNFIIYSNNGIYAASLNGLDKECLVKLNDNVDFTTDGKYVFWRDYCTFSGDIHRLDLASGEQKKLDFYSGSFYKFMVFNNKIYYITTDGAYECDLDGLNSVKLQNKLNFTGSTQVYFSNSGLYIEDYENEKFYSCGFNGENPVEFGLETAVNYWIQPTVYLTKGSTYALPKTILAVMVDGSAREMPVLWDNNQVNTSVLGNYSYTGSVIGYTDKVALDVTVASTGVYGNNAGNKSNNCLVAKYGDWIIYSNQSHLCKLYKMKSDGTSKMMVSDNSSSNINVYGDWIYYTSSGVIRRIKPDGTYDTVVAKGTVLTFKDGWLYYIDEDTLCKARLDGCGSTVITNNVAKAFTDETSLYVETSDLNLHKINFDGTNNVVIYHAANSYVLDFSFSKDYIFFYDYNPPESVYGVNLFKMKKDGTGLTKIPELEGGLLWIDDNYIYRTDFASYGLARTNLDGTGKITMPSGTYSGTYSGNSKINVIDEWIYFYTYQGYNSYVNYRVKLDGTVQAF